MLNDAMDEVVLVKGWKKGANWSFPRGKINKDEKDLDCAVREVYEETGFDVREAGLVGKDEDMKFIEVTMREQHMRLYVFRGVPYHTHFEPRTRKEISKIKWYKLSELPTLKKNKNHQEGHGEDLAVNANKFYMVAPFLVPLKKWIAQQSKHDVLKGSYENQLAPTTVPQEPRMVETQVSDSVNYESPTTDDMGRLMASLRQSGQVRSIGDLPEISPPNGSREDAAAQSKSLPRVQQPETTPGPLMLKTSTADEAKSNALLALLRGGNKNNGTNAVQPQPPPPHTPFEQASEAARMPKSPRHHPPQPPRFSEMPPPPSFPLPGPPAQDGPIYSGPPVFSSDPHPDMVSRQPLNVPQSPTRATGRYPITAPQPVRQQHIISSSRDDNYDAVFPLAPQSRYQAPAPYRRTGDPEFVQAPQNVNNLPHSIPPASRLPPPKLTTHSSALLSIFRTGRPDDQPTDAKPVELPQSSTPASIPTGLPPARKTEALASQTAAENNQNSEKQKHVQQKKGPAAVLSQWSDIGVASASPHSLPYPNQDGEKVVKGFFDVAQDPSMSAETNAQFKASASRRQHQDALLNLFRKPSTTLGPPSAPVELSAMPSPSHSREPSQVSNSIPASSPQQVNNGNVTIAKRPTPAQTHNKAPVSATVTGPLNLPQFEAITKKPKETKSINGTLKKPGLPDGIRAPPMTILSRPTNTQGPAPQVQPINAASASKTSGSYMRMSSATARTLTESKEAPKPFQPQILRRPPQPQSPPQPLLYETTAGRLTPPPHPDRLLVDRRDSHPREHKQALLSLFNKPSPVNSPSLSAHTAIVSPLSDRTALADNLGSSLPTPSRSRIGSLTSMIGDGSVRLSSGKQTPRTTPVDRTFLLGYLEGVAKGDRR